MQQKTKQTIVHKNRFEIDTEGFKTQMSEIKPFRLCLDMVQNCMDEDSIKEFEFTTKYNEQTKLWTLTFKDDGDGFRKTSDTYTLYGHSYKRNDPTKIGMYNLGEKQFFAVAVKGEIMTRNLHVRFYDNVREEETLQEPVKGTVATGDFDFTKSEVDDIIKSMKKVLVPQGKTFKVNGEIVTNKQQIKSFNAELWTQKENENHKMIRLKQNTKVELYETLEDERPFLYGLGVPIVKLHGSLKWHVNVCQKVPQTSSRNVVSEAYLKELYGVILNNAVDLIDEESSGSTFVQIGMKSATKETATQILEKQFGTSQVYIQSQTDHRANESALDNGGVLLRTGFLDGEARSHLQDLGLVQKASDVFKTDYAKAEKVKPTEKMKWFAKVISLMSQDAIGQMVNSDFVSAPEATVEAQYDKTGNKIIWNVGLLGKEYFNKFDEEQIDLAIHELSHDLHDISEDGLAHYSHEYVHELSRIGSVFAKKGIKYYLDLAKA